MFKNLSILNSCAHSYAFHNIFVVSLQKAFTKYEADLTNRVVVDEEVSLRRIPASPQLKGSQTRHWVFGLREVNYSLLIEPTFEEENS